MKKQTLFKKGQMSKIGLIFGPLLFVSVVFIFPIDSLSYDGKIVLGITMWMTLWWVTEVIPIYVTALIPLLLFPSFGIMQLGDVSGAYADRIVFLFLGGFLVAKAIEKTGLHKRFALNILKFCGTKPKNIIAAFIIVTGFLSAWISNTSTAMLMVPIASAILLRIENDESRKRFGLCLMLSIAYSASLGGLATLIGTPPNAIFASLASDLHNVDVNFGDWMLVGMPISAVSLFVLWLYIVNFGVKINGKALSLIKEKKTIYSDLKSLGRINNDEKLAAVVFCVTAFMWITRGLLWKDLLPMIDDTTIVLVSAFSLFLLPSRSHKPEPSVSNLTESLEFPFSEASYSKMGHTQKTKRLLDWNTAVQIPWGVLLLIGGGLALASGFQATGLDEWIANNLTLAKDFNYLIIILVVVAITIFASEIMSNTATAAVFIPISASLGTSISIDPLLLMAPIAIATSFGFVMPAGTPPNAIVYTSRYITAAKMARVGIPLDLIGIFIVTFMSAILVPMVFTHK